MGAETEVAQLLADLPPDRREALTAVRQTILANLPDGFVESVDYGMITYVVPLATYPDTYNGKPLQFAAVASQKRHMAVYLSGIYADAGQRQAFEDSYRATGKRMDVGASCVRFRTLDDLPLDVVGRAISAVDLPTFVATYEASRTRR